MLKINYNLHKCTELINLFAINTDIYIKNQNCDELFNKALQNNNNGYLQFILKNGGIIENINFNILLKNGITFDFFELLIVNLNFNNLDMNNKNILYWLCKLDYDKSFIDICLKKNIYLSEDELNEMSDTVRKMSNLVKKCNNPSFKLRRLNDSDKLNREENYFSDSYDIEKKRKHNFNKNIIFYDFFRINIEYKYKNYIDLIIEDIRGGQIHPIPRELSNVECIFPNRIMLFLLINYISIEQMIVKLINSKISINYLLQILCDKLSLISVKNSIYITNIISLDNFCKIVILLLKMNKGSLIIIDDKLLTNHLLLNIFYFYDSINIKYANTQLVKIYSSTNILLLCKFLKINMNKDIITLLLQNITFNYETILEYFYDIKKINTTQLRIIINNINSTNFSVFINFIIKKNARVNKFFIKDIINACIRLEKEEMELLEILKSVNQTLLSEFNIFELLLNKYQVNNINKFTKIIKLLIINGLDIDKSVHFLINYPYLNKNFNHSVLLNIIQLFINNGYEINKIFSNYITENSEWKFKKNKNILYWSLKKYDFKKLSNDYLEKLVEIFCKENILPLDRDDIHSLDNLIIKNKLQDYLNFCEKNMRLIIINNYKSFETVLIDINIKKFNKVNFALENIISFLNFEDLKNFNNTLFY